MNQCKESIKPISACGRCYFLLMLLGLIILGIIISFNCIKVDSTDKMNESVILKHDKSKLITDLRIKKTLHSDKCFSDKCFIVFIICDSVLICITLVLFYLTEQKYNEHICKTNKAILISRELIAARNKTCSDSILNQIKGHKNNGNNLTKNEEEFYLLNKATIDFFKAYANAITDL